MIHQPTELLGHLRDGAAHLSTTVFLHQPTRLRARPHDEADRCDTTVFLHQPAADVIDIENYGRSTTVLDPWGELTIKTSASAFNGQTFTIPARLVRWNGKRFRGTNFGAVFGPRTL